MSIDRIKEKRAEIRRQGEVDAVADTLGKKIASSIKPQSSDELLKVSRQLAQSVDKLSEGLAKSLQQTLDTVDELGQIVAAIKSIKIPTPVVNLPAQKMQAIEKPAVRRETGALDGYKPQDIKEADGRQYIGYQNAAGGWYIIENNLKKQELRYVFGRADYAKAFKEAEVKGYKLLSEAINAL